MVLVLPGAAAAMAAALRGSSARPMRGQKFNAPGMTTGNNRSLGVYLRPPVVHLLHIGCVILRVIPLLAVVDGRRVDPLPAELQLIV